MLNNRKNIVFILSSNQINLPKNVWPKQKTIHSVQYSVQICAEIERCHSMWLSTWNNGNQTSGHQNLGVAQMHWIFVVSSLSSFNTVDRFHISFSFSFIRLFVALPFSRLRSYWIRFICTMYTTMDDRVRMDGKNLCSLNVWVHWMLGTFAYMWSSHRFIQL